MACLLLRMGGHNQTKDMQFLTSQRLLMLSDKKVH